MRCLAIYRKINFWYKIWHFRQEEREQKMMLMFSLGSYLNILKSPFHCPRTKILKNNADSPGHVNYIAYKNEENKSTISHYVKN